MGLRAPPSAVREQTPCQEAICGTGSFHRLSICGRVIRLIRAGQVIRLALVKPSWLIGYDGRRRLAGKTGGFNVIQAIRRVDVSRAGSTNTYKSCVQSLYQSKAIIRRYSKDTYSVCSRMLFRHVFLLCMMFLDYYYCLCCILLLWLF